MTKAEMQAEINRLRQRVAELEGEVKGLQFLVSLPKDPAPLPYYPSNDPWSWPQQGLPTWSQPCSNPYPIVTLSTTE
jgi:hypothetical protein